MLTSRYWLGELAELLVVARLLAERLDGADARHRLDEVDDDLRADCARLAVHQLGARVEPAHEQPERQPHDDEHHAALPVDEHERDQREPAVEDARDELVEPSIEQLPDRVQVARLARDDAAGRVRLVELEAQALRVPEDPLAQIEHDGLGEASGHDDVPADQGRATERRDQVDADDHDGRHPIRFFDNGGKRRVDAVGDERGAEHPQHGRDHEHAQGQHELPALRTQERAEQAQRPRADLRALELGVVGAVFARGAGHRCGGHRVTSLSSSRRSGSSSSTGSPAARAAISRLEMT